MTTDRDESIERLLRRAHSPDPHALDGSSSDCPDAEMLAALADDTLPDAARREVEGHIADCHRCQAMTAAMVRAEMPTGSPAIEAAGAVAAWRRRAFNWLVPAAAAATAVALWILIPGQRTPLPEQPQADSQVAAPASPPPLQTEVVTEEPLRLPGESLADSAARERNANVAQEKAAPAPPAAASPAGAGQAAREQSGSLEERVTVGAPPSRDASADRAEASPPAPPGVVVTGESPIAIAPQDQRSAGAAAPAAPAALGATAALRRAVSGFEVLSPDPRIRWSVGPSPIVQYSADGGATWTAQQTGATAELTAGSAPSPTVAWLVGRRSLVLRTTDGGRRWERVTFPETIDLTAVTASTAVTATVTLADGRRLTTTDGGKTWAAR
jgi:hypothetical protein